MVFICFCALEKEREPFRFLKKESKLLLFCSLPLRALLPESSWYVLGPLGEKWCWWLLSGHRTTDWHNPPYGTGELEPSFLWQSSPWPAAESEGVEKLSKASESKNSWPSCQKLLAFLLTRGSLFSTSVRGTNRVKGPGPAISLIDKACQI